MMFEKGQFIGYGRVDDKSITVLSFNRYINQTVLILRKFTKFTVNSFTENKSTSQKSNFLPDLLIKK